MVCLVIVYNHHFVQNIEKLKSLYGNRFSEIIHVMPFLEDELPGVVPVYGNSFTFSGFIAQAKRALLESSAETYVFITDDLILNPSVNEGNILESVALDRKQAYLKRVDPLSASIRWSWLQRHILFHHEFSKGVEWQDLLPSYEDVANMLANRFPDVVTQRKIHLLTIARDCCIKKQWKTLYYTLDLMMKHRSFTYEFDLPYVHGYSDFFIVPRTSLAQFSNYCGVFASMNLFVEIAIPTALMIACPSVKVESDDCLLKGKEFWDEEEFNAFATSTNYEIARAFEEFPEALYIHPLKLSKWR